MSVRDRLVCMVLLLAAACSWVAVGWLVASFTPVGQPAIQLAGALLLGGATGVTVWPLAWLTRFAAHRRIAYRGSWGIAARRAALAGLVVTVLVLLRGLGSPGAPLAIFVVALAVLVELGFVLRR